MTREEILAMKPSRELDWLVAERVLAYKLHWARPGVWGGVGNIGGRMEWIPCGPDEHGAEKVREDGIGVHEYSKTGPAAWDVIQHMAEDGWALTLYSGPLGKWWVGFHRGKQQTLNAGDTAPVAICRAALLAMEDKPMG